MISGKENSRFLRIAFKLFRRIKKPRQNRRGISTIERIKLHVSSLIQTLTVGFGISPNQPPQRVADYTAGGELHPAPKNFLMFHYFFILRLCALIVNRILINSVLIHFALIFIQNRLPHFIHFQNTVLTEAVQISDTYQHQYQPNYNQKQVKSAALINPCSCA